MLVQTIEQALEQPPKPKEGIESAIPEWINDQLLEDKTPEAVVDEIAEKLALIQKDVDFSKSLSDEELTKATQKLRVQLTPQEGKQRRDRSPLPIGEICNLCGIKVRTYYDWLSKLMKNGSLEDPPRHPCVNPRAYSQEDKDRVIALFADRRAKGESIGKIYEDIRTSGAEDQQKFLPSERTIYKIFHEAGELESREPKQARHPDVTKTKRKSYTASAINQLWCYDITYLNSTGDSKYYGIAIVDVYSRYLVASDVFDLQNDANVADFVENALRQYDIAPHQLVLHSDNGSQMKSKLIKQIMERFGVEESHSRPRVSNDNAIIERIWRTLKNGPYKLKSRVFTSLEEAKTIFSRAVDYYNHSYHSSLKKCTPDAVFNGYATEQIQARKKYEKNKRCRQPEHYPSSNPEEVSTKLEDSSEEIEPTVFNPQFSDKEEEIQ